MSPEGAGGGGEGVLDIMHGRSRMAMDARTSTKPGRTGQTLLAPSAPCGVGRVA